MVAIYIFVKKKKKDHDPFTCQSLVWFKLISLIHMGIDNTVHLLFLAFKVPTAFVLVCVYVQFVCRQWK